MKLSRANKYLFWFSITKIPLIAYVGPKIVELSDVGIVLRIKSRRRNNNHLKSVYVAALAVGADISSGFLAFIKAREGNVKISFIFKSMKCEFLKRPMSDVYFECNNGEDIDEMISESKITGKRINKVALINAYTEYYKEKELIATFEMETSIKVLD